MGETKNSNNSLVQIGRAPKTEFDTHKLLLCTEIFSKRRKIFSSIAEEPELHSTRDQVMSKANETSERRVWPLSIFSNISACVHCRDTNRSEMAESASDLPVEGALKGFPSPGFGPLH